VGPIKPLTALILFSVDLEKALTKGALRRESLGRPSYEANGGIISRNLKILNLAPGVAAVLEETVFCLEWGRVITL
jgi:hypothetical protein